MMKTGWTLDKPMASLASGGFCFAIFLNHVLLNLVCIVFMQNMKKGKQGVLPKTYSTTDPDYVTWVPPDGRIHCRRAGSINLQW